MPPRKVGGGGSFLGERTGGRWQEKEEAHINVLELEVLPCYSSICQGDHESTPYSGAYRQLHGGIIHKQARGDTFTDSGISGVRDMELLHLSENMDYSVTCSRSDKHIEADFASRNFNVRTDGLSTRWYSREQPRGSIRKKWTSLPLGSTTSYHAMW